MKKHRTIIIIKTIINKIVLIVGDTISLLFSFYIAYNIKVFLHNIGVLSIETPPIDYYFQYWYLIFIYIFFLYFYRIYNIRFSFWQDLKRIIKAILIGTVFVFFILALQKISQEVSRFIILFMIITSISLIAVVKYLLKFVLYRYGMWQINSLVIANKDKDFEGVLNNLHSNWYIGYRAGYIIELNENNGSLESFTREQLEIIIMKYNIVLPILYKINKNSFFDVFIKLDVYFHNIKLVPDLHSLFVNNISVEGDGDNLIINFNNNLLKLHNKVLQYFFNKIASIIITFFMSPFLLIISIMINISSKGPVLYKARRIGFLEKDIWVYKFRTMYNDAEKKLADLLKSSPQLKDEFEKNFKLKEDPRVTRIGKFLRKTSLDELPQLFNVLKGEMNLIGPRPIVKREIKMYGEAYHELVKVKPGISGLWQVSGRNDLQYDKRVQLDLFYIKNWSIWMDIIILIRTLKVVIYGKGAY